MDFTKRTFVVMFCTAAAVTYKGAVVEQPIVDDSSYTLRKELTAEATVALAKEAAQAGAQIIVFPEYGLIGFPTWPYESSQKAAYAELFDEIPEPTGDVPCANPAKYASSPTVVALSCGAKDNNISIVGCMGDIVKCPDSAYPGCLHLGEDEHLQFNTAVAFDTDGTFLLKYHKTNFWGEDEYLDVPQTCEDKAFTTSFGVTFGLFICADVLYEFPPERLLHNGIRNFVSPIWWSNYMAHMQAMSWHQGWSLRNCANVLFANYGPGASGSGIMSCGRVEASYYKTPSAAGIIYADLDSDPPAAPASALVPSLSTDETGPQGWRFASLAAGKVCSGEICCVASEIVGDVSGYAIAALSGSDSGCGYSAELAATAYDPGHDCGTQSLHWPGEACGVFSCAAPAAACLLYQTPAGSLTGIRLEMAVSAGTAVYPHVLAYDGTSASTEQVLLEPGVGLDFLHNGTGAVLVVTSPSPITSAEMYGRPYTQDSLSYSCPTAAPTVSPPASPTGVPTGTPTASPTAGDQASGAKFEGITCFILCFALGMFLC